MKHSRAGWPAYCCLASSITRICSFGLLRTENFFLSFLLHSITLLLLYSPSLKLPSVKFTGFCPEFGVALVHDRRAFSLRHERLPRRSTQVFSSSFIFLKQLVIPEYCVRGTTFFDASLLLPHPRALVPKHAVCPSPPRPEYSKAHPNDANN